MIVSGYISSPTPVEVLDVYTRCSGILRVVLDRYRRSGPFVRSRRVGQGVKGS